MSTEIEQRLVEVRREVQVYENTYNSLAAYPAKRKEALEALRSLVAAHQEMRALLVHRHQGNRLAAIQRAVDNIGVSLGNAILVTSNVRKEAAL